MSAMFDTYKLLLRPQAYWNRVIVDMMFLLTQGCFIFYLLFLSNGGIIRFYLVLAVLLGIAFYYALLQSIYIPILNSFIRFTIRVYQLLSRLIQTLIIRPVIWIIQLAVAILVGIISIIWKLVTVVYRVVAFFIRPFIPKFVQNYLLNLLSICSRIIIKLKKDLLDLLKFRRRKNDEADS